MNHILFVQSSVNPLDVRVNKRFSNQVLPPEVRIGIARIMSDTMDAIVVQDYHPDRGYFDVELWFTFPNERGDVDGPIKRTIDAIFDGIKRVRPDSGAHDGRVHTVIAHKLSKVRDNRPVGIEAEVRPHDFREG